MSIQAIQALARRHPVLSGIVLYALVVACITRGPIATEQHRWWAGLGPVLPHDTFPADCTLCHEGTTWNELVPNFEFDHEKETGVALMGAHEAAACLLCHNDRGPIEVFTARGCAGCHEDIHLGQLGNECTECHVQSNWRPFGQFELHQQTRFPLVGVHAAISCRRCHPGAEIGRFVPTSIECFDCHRQEYLNTTIPNHANIGYGTNCELCHQPTTWFNAELPSNF